MSAQPIFHWPGLPSCRCLPVSSNVRPRNESPAWSSAVVEIQKTRGHSFCSARHRDRRRAAATQALLHRAPLQAYLCLAWCVFRFGYGGNENTATCSRSRSAASVGSSGGSSRRSRRGAMPRQTTLTCSQEQNQFNARHTLTLVSAERGACLRACKSSDINPSTGSRGAGRRAKTAA